MFTDETTGLVQRD